MKKKLTALFLAAALTLPTLATSIFAGNEAVDPIELGKDLMPLSTTSAKVIDVEDGNGYLHLYDRLNTLGSTSNVVTALGWQPAKNYQYLKGTVIYYVSLKARMANNFADQSEIGDEFPDDAATMYYRLTTGGSLKVFDIWADKLDGVTYAGSGGDRWDKNPNIALAKYVGNPANFKSINKNVDLYGKFTSEYANMPAAYYGTKTYSDGADVILDDTWRTFVWAFVPRMDYTVGMKNGQYFIAFSSASGAYRNIPVDIDDFEVWYYDANGAKVSLADYDFNDTENPTHGYMLEPSDRYGRMFSVNGASRQGFNKHFKVANIKEYDYLEVGADASGAAVKEGTVNYSFGDGIKLDAGVYEFTAEARLNFYDGYLENEKTNKLIPQFIENEDNRARLEMKDNYGGSWGASEIGSEWSTVKYTLTVPKGLDFTLTDVNAVFTDDTASVNKAFNIRNAKLVKTETFFPDTEFEASKADVIYTIEDDAFNVSKGASGAKTEMVYSESFTEGNRYLTVSGRTNERDGFILDLREIADNSATNDYRLSFKIRASRELKNLSISSNDSKYDPTESMIKLSAGLYRGQYVEAAPSTFVPNDQRVNYYRHRLGSAGAYWWYFGNDEWRTVDVPFNDFVQNEEGVSTRYNVIQLGGAETAFNAIDFDIDDIRIYSASKGEIWKQDFQSEAAGELSDEMKSMFVPFKETWLPDTYREDEVTLGIGEDAPYFTAKNVSELTYTVPEYAKMELEYGWYTLHADFSYPSFDADRVTAAVGGDRNRNYIRDNKNGYEVTAVIETADRNYRTDSYIIDGDWASCSFSFKASEPISVDSIKFIFTDASGAEFTDVIYRNVYLDGNLPDEPGIPPAGIVMMLLLKRQNENASELENAEAQAERALSDRDVVYSITDSSVKAIADTSSTKAKTEYPESFEKGNKYLRVSGRANNRDGIIIDLRRAVFDVSEADYRLSFRIRSASALYNMGGGHMDDDSIRLGEGLYNGAYTPASPSIFGKATITSPGFDSSLGGWYFTGSEWTTVDVSFKELKNQNVIHIGGGALGINASDFDIDYIKVYIKGEETPVYLETFDNAKAGELSEELKSFYIPFSNGNVAGSYRIYDVAVQICEDREYLTANASELKYTMASDERSTLEAGEYTLHASFRHPDYDASKLEIAETEDSKKQSYIKSNLNSFDVTAVIETSDGEITFDKYTVRNSAVDCEFDFSLDKEAVIESVSFVITAADGSKTSKVCFGDVYIDGDITK